MSLKAQLRDARVFRTIAIPTHASTPAVSDNSHVVSLLEEKYRAAAAAGSHTVSADAEQSSAKEEYIYCMLVHTQWPTTVVTARHILNAAGAGNL
jgi:hypothetical protein